MFSNIKFIIPWVICFVFVNFFGPDSGGTNANSRFATLRAMSTEHSFQIDNYKNWTIDWSQTPDGHYYSNKAPGPMFIGFVPFVILDSLSFKNTKNEISNKPVYNVTKKIVSFLTQMLPFVFLVLILAQWLYKIGISYEAINFFILSILFGNTASLYMSTFFGHGLAAVLIIACLMTLYTRKFFWFGMLSGFALLTDYSMALLFPPLFAIAIWQEKKNFDWIIPCLLGSILPATLWVWYHWVAFGSPFSISQKYVNPELFTIPQSQANLGGIFNLSLQPKIIYALLFGPYRGILYTQPWILFASLICCGMLFNFKVKLHPVFIKLSIFTFISLFFLLIMNSSFGAWHGGGTIGPRYLCMIFPLFSLMIALCFDHLKRPTQLFLWILLGITIVFASLVYSTGTLKPETQLVWVAILKKFHFSLKNTHIFLKFACFYLLFFIAFRYVLALHKKTRG